MLAKIPAVLAALRLGKYVRIPCKVMILHGSCEAYERSESSSSVSEGFGKRIKEANTGSEIG